jgi:hypothetical protein
MPNDATVSYEDDPNHMIIWLDSTIGDLEQCLHLKDAFSSTAHPKNETPVKLIDSDYDQILRSAGPTRVNFEGVWFLLAAFTDVELCIQCFEQNQHKRIFFITSGSLGKKAVPRIIERFERTFIDPVTNEPYNSIYVFCLHIEYQMDWAYEYIRYIQIFDHEADLLHRMIRDIGNYFVMISKRLLAEDPPNNSAAYHRLSWAHELYERYCKMDNISMRRELDEVKRLLKDAEE